MKTPVVESAGTGGGMKLFCSGAGEDTPDMTNTHAHQEERIRGLRQNGVSDIVEIRSADGLTVPSRPPDMKLTKQQLFMALAKQVPD
jgi:phosphate transport system substrate-binding protein